jgi:hypothetical protein
LFLVIGLIAIVLSPTLWATPRGADSYYYSAANTVISKCGNAELLGIIMRQGINRYIFTPGICGLGSASKYVEIDYHYKTTGNPTCFTFLIGKSKR